MLIPVSMNPWFRLVSCAACVLSLAVFTLQGAESAPVAPKSAADKPASSLYVRHARSGHVSNYDEAKVSAYTLPDPLKLENGQRVRDADTWFSRRRPEILRAYENEIYGHVPATAPRAHPEVVASGDVIENGAGLRKHVIVRFGPDANGPKADVVMYLPAHAAKPIPVLLQLVFFRGLRSEAPEEPLPPAIAKAAKKGQPFSETGPVADILARGYAYATFRYTDVQHDDAKTSDGGVEALAYAAGQTKPAPSEWGTISVWSWAASRVLDYLETDREVDAKRVAIVGHSRLGKTALWTGARDTRFALVFSSCSGEMGASLARRDFGETVDDMAENFPWQFAGNFQKYIGHWKDLPVDAHMLIALSAPRPVFVTGGSEDLWADPHGEFLAEVAAGPVYRLVGKKDLGVTELPPLDTAVIDGDLGWRYHTGGHAILPEDWKAFLDFADRHLK